MKKIESQILESPPRFGSLQSNLSCPLSSHGHGHVPEDMLHTSSDCRLAQKPAARDRDESCIDDLAAAGLEALGAEVCLEHLEEHFNHSRFTQSICALRCSSAPVRSLDQEAVEMIPMEST